MPDPLALLEGQAEDEGYEPNTPQYEARLVVLKLERCMEFQSVTRCSDCRASLDCQLRLDLAHLKVFGVAKPE